MKGCGLGLQAGRHRKKKIIYLNEFTSDPIIGEFEIMITQENKCYLNRIGRIRDWKELEYLGVPGEIIIMIKLKHGNILP